MGLDRIISELHLARSCLRCLIFPLYFLNIKFSYHKWIVFRFPFVVASLSVLIIFLFPDIKIRGSESFIANINSLLSVLVGFFIASLAAVATFDNKIIDGEFIGEKPRLPSALARPGGLLTLTRRQYLSLLFGYLTSAGLFLYFLGVCIQIAPNDLTYYIHLIDNLRKILRPVLIGIYVYAIVNLFFTMLLGLYFLSFGIHRTIPEVRDSNRID